MLCIAMAKVKAGTYKERVTRRAGWRYPEGVRVVAEYWPVGGEYSVITIAEADSAAQVLAAVAPWSDVLDFTITPAVTAEEGLRAAEQMMKG